MDGEDCEKSGGVFDLFAKIYIFVHYHIKCQYLVNKSMRNALKNLYLQWQHFLRALPRLRR